MTRERLDRGDREVSCEIAIVGGGFAGSILGRALAKRGRKVVLVEGRRHPRFALGESSTPLAGFALERLARDYDLPDLHQLAAYGRWMTALPHLRRGLKRGFTFYLHHRGEPWRGDSRLLVAASPEDALADSHWLRADVDHHLLRAAAAAGVDVREATRLSGLEVAASGVRLHGEGPEGELTLRAGFVVDASGGAGFLARHLPLAEAAPTPGVPEVASGLLYGHFEGVADFTESSELDLPLGPYPDSRAAIHHLLAEGWMYQLPFDPVPCDPASGDGGVVSAGFLVDHHTQAENDLPQDFWQRPPQDAWAVLLRRYPSLAVQFKDSKPLFPIAAVPHLQYRRSRAADIETRRWLLLPHAYAFVDPLYSTGMAWSLLAVERAAALLSSGDLPPTTGLARYQDLLSAEADQAQRLVSGAYRARRDFELFTAQSFLYFATVSFAELGQRLTPEAKDWAWEGFLGAADPFWEERFAQAHRRLASPSPEAFPAWVAEAIAPRNLIGLADPSRHGLYPVDLEVLLNRADLLGLSRQEMERRLPWLRGGMGMTLQ